jgi:hypothetical protein
MAAVLFKSSSYNRHKYPGSSNTPMGSDSTSAQYCKVPLAEAVLAKPVLHRKAEPSEMIMQLEIPTACTASKL